MVKYVASFRRPFTNGKRLLIGIFLSYVPIINWFAVGYKLRCATTAMRGQYELPEWNKWKDLFVKGFFANLILFIYALPVLVLLIFLLREVLTNITSSGFQYFATESARSFSNYFTLLWILSLFFLYFSPAAVVSYAEYSEFKRAFSLSALKGAVSFPYLKAWLVSALYFMVIIFIFMVVVIYPVNWLMAAVPQYNLGTYLAYMLEVSILFIPLVTLWTLLGAGHYEGVWKWAKKSKPHHAASA